MEDRIERGKQWLENLLTLMGMPTTATSEGFATITEDRESCWLNIGIDHLTSEQIQLLIGERGKNIDAIQYLANTLLNLLQSSESQGSYTIELDGYRVTRYQELLEIADTAAAQVRDTGQEIEVPDLSSAERKQIHSFLQNSTDLVTESRGQEPDRKLVVKLR
ncbi:putative RNA-binding protein [Hyella patelloides LEGE 07179]|uniref:Putative RNA-binding protein n=1 Tax=Hyella patelloides LEGE 07179 TaxID=945734 RepID=A0A563VKR2_9CYAN|nr:R3H domain-containing nucleic acid-binding protein [Hyella patelloides]VEP12034.1 putative RNA-binding protein [Hyella patelloides LEGE 07179]